MEWRLPWVPAQLERARVYDVDTRGAGGRFGAHTARLGVMSKGSLQSRKNIIWMEISIHDFHILGGRGVSWLLQVCVVIFKLRNQEVNVRNGNFNSILYFFFFDGFHKRWVQYISSESILLSSIYAIFEGKVYLGISCRAWRVTGSRGSWVAWWGTWWRSWVPRRWRWMWCVVTRHPLMLRTEML